jgi:hypothetical protein
MPIAIINPKTPPSPPNVTNTTQLPDTSPVDNAGAVSQVDTKSLNSDLSIDRIEKETAPSPDTPTLTSDRLHTHTDIDWLWSESRQEISRREGEEEDCTVAWQLIELDLTGQDRRPLKGEEEPLQAMIKTSPEGHSKERFSATPATQSTSKEVMFGAVVTGEEANLSLCCRVTLIKQATPPLTLQGELPNDKISGRDNADSVTVSLKLVPFRGDLVMVDDWTRASEIEIWKGKTRLDKISIDGWESEAERRSDLFANDSRSVSGIERFNKAEDELEEEAERKKEEERRERVTLETASWASNMSDITNSL